MIKNKDDLKEYIKCDLIAQGFSNGKVSIKDRVLDLFFPKIYKYEIKLRKLEYFYNTHDMNKKINKLIFQFKRNSFDSYGFKFGFSLSINVIGPGLCLCHAGMVVINGHSKIGANARIHSGVNIGNFSRFGEEHSYDNAPIIGDNCYIGPGAKLYGKINIGDNVAIGANAVVNKTFGDNVTLAGAPARIINNVGSKDMIIEGYKNVVK